MTFLRESTLAIEGPLQVSKALKLPLLIDADEIQDLFLFLESCAEFSIFLVHGLVKKNEGILSKKDFLMTYSRYVETLKKCKIPDEKEFRPFFSSAISLSSECFYSIPVEKEYHLIKANRPVIQMQPHSFHFSKEDFEFRSMTFGPESINWGIQFSYPQLYQDFKTQEIYQVKDTPYFQNTALFKKIQKWIRDFTLPTPFIIEGKKINVPIRMGKKCFSWIHQHPQLSGKGIGIHGCL